MEPIHGPWIRMTEVVLESGKYYEIKQWGLGTTCFRIVDGIKVWAGKRPVSEFDPGKAWISEVTFHDAPQLPAPYIDGEIV